MPRSRQAYLRNAVVTHNPMQRMLFDPTSIAKQGPSIMAVPDITVIVEDMLAGWTNLITEVPNLFEDVINAILGAIDNATGLDLTGLGTLLDDILSWIDNAGAAFQQGWLGFQQLINGIVGGVDKDVSDLIAALSQTGTDVVALQADWQIVLDDLGLGAIPDLALFLADIQSWIDQVGASLTQGWLGFQQLIAGVTGGVDKDVSDLIAVLSQTGTDVVALQGNWQTLLDDLGLGAIPDLALFLADIQSWIDQVGASLTQGWLGFQQLITGITGQTDSNVSDLIAALTASGEAFTALVSSVWIAIQADGGYSTEIAALESAWTTYTTTVTGLASADIAGLVQMAGSILGISPADLQTLQSEFTTLQTDVTAGNTAFSTLLSSAWTAVETYTSWSAFLTAVEAAWSTYVTTVSSLTSGEFATVEQILDTLLGIDPNTGKTKGNVDTVYPFLRSRGGLSTSTYATKAILTAALSGRGGVLPRPHSSDVQMWMTFNTILGRSEHSYISIRGSGVLSATAVNKQFILSVALASRGALTPVMQDWQTFSSILGVVQHIYPVLSGRGVLAATAKSTKFSPPAILSGRGVLTGIVQDWQILPPGIAPLYGLTPLLAGRGVLRATAASVKFSLPVALTARGVLNPVIQDWQTFYSILGRVEAVYPALASRGVLSATARSVKFSVPVALSNHGALLPAISDWQNFPAAPIYGLTPPLSGRGVVKATSASVRFLLTAALSSRGALATTLQAQGETGNNVSYGLNPTLSGRGVLKASAASVRFLIPSALSGRGATAAIVQDWQTFQSIIGRVEAIYPALTSQGVLRATVRSTKFSLPGVLSGHGALSPIIQYWQTFYSIIGRVEHVYSTLSSRGVLQATANSVKFTPSVTLSSRGALVAIVQDWQILAGTVPPIYGLNPPLAGRGVLRATASSVKFSLPATLASRGVLNPVVQDWQTFYSILGRVETVYPTLSSRGVLQATAKSVRFSLPAILPSHGVLQGTVQDWQITGNNVSYGLYSALSSGGALTATAKSTKFLLPRTLISSRGVVTPVVQDWQTFYSIMGRVETIYPTLSGRGVLKATAASVKFTLPVALPSRGVLAGAIQDWQNFPAAPIYGLNPVLAGLGILRATAASKKFILPASLSGRGALVTGTQLQGETGNNVSYGLNPTLAGRGVLAAAAASKQFKLPATLSGRGALAAVGQEWQTFQSILGRVEAIYPALTSRGALSSTTPGSVTFDAVGAGYTGAGQPFSYQHTINGNAIVGFFSAGAAGTPVTTLSVGGVAMTQVASLIHYATNVNFFVFELLNPPIGVQTISGTGTISAAFAANTVSYNNVVSFGAPVTNTGTGSPNLTVQNIVGQMIAAGFSDFGANFSAFNKTQRFNVPFTAAQNYPMLVGDTSATAGTFVSTTLVGNQCDTQGNGSLTASVQSSTATSIGGQTVSGLASGVGACPTGRGVLAGVAYPVVKLTATDASSWGGVAVSMNSLPVPSSARVSKFQLPGQLSGHGALTPIIQDWQTFYSIMGRVEAVYPVLGSQGVLRATAVSKQFKLPVGLAGRGAVQGTVNDWQNFPVAPIYGLNPVLSGRGVLAATAASKRFILPAVLSGRGTLAPTTQLQGETGNNVSYGLNPTLAGRGVLAAAAASKQFRLPAGLSGRGVLTPTVQDWQTFQSIAGRVEAVYPVLTSQGVLRSTAKSTKFSLPVALPGRGALVANIQDWQTFYSITGRVEAVYPTLSGRGVLQSVTAVAYDTTGAGNHAVITGTGITTAHTLSGNATAILVAVSNFITSDTYANVTSNSCVIGSTPMTLLGVVTNGNIASTGWTEVWGLINPPTGAQTITYKEAAGASFPTLLINSVSYTNVASFGTAVTNFANTASLTTGGVTSAIGNMVFAAMSGGGSAFPLVISGSGTQRANQAVGGYIDLLVQDIAGAPTDTLTATRGGAANWGTVAVNMAPIPASAQAIEFTLPAALSSRGVLAGTVQDWQIIPPAGVAPIYGLLPSLHGLGILRATAASKKFTLPASLSAGGALIPIIQDWQTFYSITGRIEAVYTSLSSQGVLRATAASKQFKLPASLPGRGVLQGTVQDWQIIPPAPIYGLIPSLPSRGVLQATTASKKFSLPAVLSGRGVFVGTVQDWQLTGNNVTYGLNPPLAGRGALRATATSGRFSLPRVLSGLGTLAATVQSWQTFTSITGVVAHVYGLPIGHGALSATAASKQFLLATSTRGRGVVSATTLANVPGGIIVGWTKIETDLVNALYDALTGNLTGSLAQLQAAWTDLTFLLGNPTGLGSGSPVPAVPAATPLFGTPLAVTDTGVVNSIGSNLGAHNITDLGTHFDNFVNTILPNITGNNFTVNQVAQALDTLATTTQGNSVQISTIQSALSEGAGLGGAIYGVTFSKYPNGAFPSVFTLAYTGAGTTGGTGQLGVANGVGQWIAGSGANGDRSVLGIYNAGILNSDFAELLATLGGVPGWGGGLSASNYGVLRSDGSSTQASATYTYARGFWSSGTQLQCEFGCYVAGAKTVFTTVPGTWNLNMSIRAGVGGNPMRFQVLTGSTVIVDWCDAQAAVNDVQTITISGSPSSSTFTITCQGTNTAASATPGSPPGVFSSATQTTAPIAYNAPSTGAGSVQAALGALTAIGSTANVGVTGSAGGPYVITFQGALQHAVQPALLVNDTFLPPTATIACAHTTFGGAVSKAGAAYRYWGFRSDTGNSGTLLPAPATFAGTQDNGPITVVGSGIRQHRLSASTVSGSTGGPNQFGASFFDTTGEETPDLSVSGNNITISQPGWYTVTIRALVNFTVSTGMMTLSGAVFRNSGGGAVCDTVMPGASIAFNVFSVQDAMSNMGGSCNLYCNAGDILSPGYYVDYGSGGGTFSSLTFYGETTGTMSYWTVTQTSKSMLTS